MNPSDWFCAVTTAPRMEPTLYRTVKSLQDAGWEPFVYAEPDSPLPVTCSVIEHKQRKGVWGNWVFAVQKAVQSNRKYALICQDDIEVHPESMSVLDWLFEDFAKEGPISVYTPRAYGFSGGDTRRSRLTPGVYPLRPKNLWGAVGIAWRVSELRVVLESPTIASWRGVKPARLSEDVVNSDVAIGRILAEMDVPIWFPVPSFGIHTARYSSIPGHGSNEVRRNRNAENPADPDEPLMPQVFPLGRSLANE